MAAASRFFIYRISALLVLLGMTCMAQRVVGQGFEISFGGNKEDEGRAIIQTVDHGYLAIGYSESFGDDNDEDIYLIRTDVDGRLVWERTYDEGFNEQAFDAVSLEDGGFVIVGYREVDATSVAQIYLLNLDKRGNIRWSKTYANTGLPQRGNHIIKTSNGGYLLTCNTENPQTSRDDILLLKVDAEGNEEWRQPYGNGRTSEGVAAMEVPDGYIFAANMQGVSGPDRDIVFFRVDTAGRFVWEKTYGTEGANEEVNDLIPTSDGHFAFVGSTRDFNSALIGKANLNGDTLWYNELEVTDFEDILNGIVEASDGSLTAAGYAIPTPNDIDMLLIHTSPDGQLLWQRRLGERANTDTGAGLARTVDGGYALVGFDAQADGVFINDLVVFKVDGLAAYRSNRLAGRVFVTADGCNAYTEEDPGLEDWIVTASTATDVFYGATDENGQFDMLVPPGEYVVELINQNDDIWSICDPTSYGADFSEEYDSARFDFAVVPITDCPVLEVAIETPFVRACAPVTYTVHYENSGSDTARNAYVDVTFDTELTFGEAEIEPSDVFAETNTYRFPLGDLFPGQRSSFEVESDVACTGILPGQAITTTARIFPDTLCGMVDPNWDGSSIQVSGTCEGDSIEFRIQNIGDGPMLQQQNYIGIEDWVIGRQGSYQLDAGAFEIISIKAREGSTYRLIAEQSPGHPGNSFPTVAIEGCTEETTYKTGLVSQFPEDDRDLFIDINVREVLDFDEVLGLRGHPKGYFDSIVAPQTDLEYTLFFVNSGTDSVDRVVIRDTLPSALDVSTLQLGAASHPYEYEVYDDGILRITFDSIFLEPGGGATAEGFVQFRLSQKPDMPIGTIIENRAAVYFENVAPEQTNVVRHVVGCGDFFATDCLLTSTNETELPAGLTVRIAPNPMRQTAVITVAGCDVCNQLSLNLYDATGRLVRQELFNGAELLFERAALPAGTYFLEVSEAGRKIASGQIVVR